MSRFFVKLKGPGHLTFLIKDKISALKYLIEIDLSQYLSFSVSDIAIIRSVEALYHLFLL